MGIIIGPAICAKPGAIRRSQREKHAMPARGRSGGAKARSAARDDKADPEQFQRFLETARELGCEENFGRFEDALKRILRQSRGRTSRAPIRQRPGEGRGKRKRKGAR